MGYKLRFVQRFMEEDRQEFLRLEREFARLEQEDAGFPQGRRYLPFTGREPSNTLLWECAFDKLEEAFAALDFLNADPRHEALYRLQSKLFLESYTEIYEELL